MAGLGTLFLSLVPATGMRDALVVTPLVQLAGVALTGLPSLRLPHTVARHRSQPDNRVPGKPC